MNLEKPQKPLLKAKWVLILVVFLGAIVIFWEVFMLKPIFKDFWARDSCLDQGGSWDYESRVCSD